MKATDARAKTDDELTGELDVLGKEIFNLRFQRANGQLENTARVRQVRRRAAAPLVGSPPILRNPNRRMPASKPPNPRKVQHDPDADKSRCRR